MCSPEVMVKVKEGITRRRMLGSLGAAGAAIAATSALGPRHSALAQEASPVASPEASPAASPVTVAALPGGFNTVVDLSHVWGPDFPMYPGAQQPQIDSLFTVADAGYYKNQLTLDEHTGTHMDVPAHFADGGTTAERLPASQLVAPLIRVDISARANADPDAQGTVDDLLAWESEHGEIPTGAFVALFSGWDRLLPFPDRYIGLDDADVAHFPGWHPEAAEFLVTERQIVGVGVDTLSLDFGASADFASHVIFLSAGRYGVENLANLARIPATGATIVVGGPKHLNASGGPTRAFALI